jgi:DNA-binding transcriptional MerR regulator
MMTSNAVSEPRLVDSELDLADQFSPHQGVVAEKMPQVHPTAVAAQVSLPSALCDEALIQEIQSIPDKMGFKIGEVADLLDVKQYVLRYWESEFDVLKPKKAANNQRYYTRKDVENAYIIRKLLYRDGFTITGARSALKDLRSFVKKEKDWSSLQQRVETQQSRVDDLLMDLRKLKLLFN